MIQFTTECNLATRFVVSILIIALLIPITFFGGQQRVSADSNLPIVNEPAPVSAPPEPFVFSSSSSENSSSNTALSSVITVKQSLSDGYRYVSGALGSPELPEGLENAKVPTLWDKVSRLLSSDVITTPVAASAATGVGKFDFDNDSKADAARWQSSTGEWKVKNSSSGNLSTVTLATSSTTVIAPADYDGDTKTDYAVLNYSTGTWTIKQSSNGATQTVTGLGQSGDKVVSGKYDGDALADEAVFRPSTGTWYVKQSSTGTVVSTAFGASTDIPAPGDYDGDGKMDYAVFRPSTGFWHFLMSGSGYAYSAFQWGISTDTPVPADYDGDGKTDCAVYRPSTGTWYVNNSNGTPYTAKTWGNYGDQPVAADYDGDGKDDFVVWRPTTGVWYIVKSSVATLDSYDYQTLGAAGDIPVESAYIKQIGGPVQPYGLAKARLAPINQTGGTNLYSRNFSWGTGLVGLPGRAGLDAGFGISYNSLVWTKQFGTMIFDADNSNVSPGFRFGFPVIEPGYFDTQTGKFAYLMVTPSGGRVEFRQDAASGFYYTADSSYAQLMANVPHSGPNQGAIEYTTLTITGTNGTVMTYVWKAGAFRCSQIEDRNGNLITIVHDEYGLLKTVTDTLGRIINVNYDGQQYPTSITQDWKDTNGAGATAQHTYATFTYANSPAISTNFVDPATSAAIPVYGPPNGTVLKVLSRITSTDGSYTTFDYNSYGQVSKISNYASDQHLLNSVRTDLETVGSAAQADCPRFTLTKSYIENFNGGAETIVHNSFQENRTFNVGGTSGTATKIEVSMDNAPHSVMSRMWYYPAGNWAEGLSFATEDFGDGAQKRWTTTAWTQDNVNLAYILNPRVWETKVGDSSNIKHTVIEYYPITLNSPITLYGLVKEVRLYDGVLGTLLKKATTTYNLSQNYIDRRIIGLPAGSYLTDGNDVLMSKVTYAYDEGDFAGTEQNISSTSPVIQHDNTNFGASFISGRGNLTSTTRCDAVISLPTNCAGGITSQTKYNTAGGAVSQITPGATVGTTRSVTISYLDSFNDGVNTRNTYAYPTKISDPANNFSQVKYRYDIGANVWAKSPAPANNTTGKETTREFDSVGRLLKETLVNNGAYTRYDYLQSDRDIHSKVFSTITDTNSSGTGDAADEVLSEAFIDGAGRVRQSRAELPSSTGGYSGSLVEYDILGRVKRSTVPTEINSSWQPAGDDNRGVDAQNNPIWLWTSQEYDWKGRVSRTINTDGTDTLVSYDGCGCAGGQVTTVQGASVPVPNQPNTFARRTQKIYADVQGRTYKTVVMKWDGTTPYTTAITDFNGRDQAASVSQTDHDAALTQVTAMTYDGYGRLKTEHRPEQIKPDNTLGYTTYNYNQDDSISSVVDARGASTNYTYNTRGLTEQISYAAPTGSNITVPSSITYAYDAMGNRTSMQDGLGTASYQYNQLSQLTSETRSFTEVTNSFTFNYTYNLSGQLASFQDAGEASRGVNYQFDKIGRLTTVGSGGFAGVTNYLSGISYRAFGTTKNMTFGSGKQTTFNYDNRLQLSNYAVSGSVAQTDFQYEADGRVKFVSDNINHTFDRSYKYDHAGRLIEGLTGAKARGETTDNGGLYQETFGYNAFSNLTNRTGWVWNTAANEMIESYQNNRQLYDNSYDADGRTTVADTLQMKFDAAGRQFWTQDSAQRRRNTPGLTITQGYDGDGQRIKQAVQYGYPGGTTFYIRSSVLGGAVIYEMREQSNGQGGYELVKNKGYVYAGGQMIAQQSLQPYSNQQTVDYIYKNPITGSQRSSNSTVEAEYDAINNPIGLTAPEPDTTQEGVSDLIIPKFADALNLSSGCTIDGMPSSCGLANSMLENGSGQQVHDYIISGRVTVGGMVAQSGLVSIRGVAADLPSQYSVGIPAIAFAQGFGEGSRISQGVIISHNGIPRDRLPQDHNGGAPPIQHPGREIFKLPQLPWENNSKMTPAEINQLEHNLDRVMSNNDCANFINAVISELPEELVSSGISYRKYSGSILDNFNRLKGEFAVSARTKNAAQYGNGILTFNQKYLQPFSNRAIAYLFNQNGALSMVSYAPSATRNSQATEALQTTFILIHELLHGYWSPATNGIVMTHNNMDRAARISVQKLGIKSKIPYAESIGDGNARYFDAVLREICGGIKL